MPTKQFKPVTAGTRFRQIRLSYPFTGALVLGALIVFAAGLWAPKLLLELRTQELANLGDILDVIDAQKDNREVAGNGVRP